MSVLGSLLWNPCSSNNRMLSGWPSREVQLDTCTSPKRHCNLIGQKRQTVWCKSCYRRVTLSQHVCVCLCVWDAIPIKLDGGPVASCWKNEIKLWGRVTAFMALLSVWVCSQVPSTVVLFKVEASEQWDCWVSCCGLHLVGLCEFTLMRLIAADPRCMAMACGSRYFLPLEPLTENKSKFSFGCLYIVKREFSWWSAPLLPIHTCWEESNEVTVLRSLYGPDLSKIETQSNTSTSLTVLVQCTCSYMYMSPWPK